MEATHLYIIGVTVFAIGIILLIGGGVLIAPYYLLSQLNMPIDVNSVKTGLQLMYAGIFALSISLALLITALAVGLFEWLAARYGYF